MEVLPMEQSMNNAAMHDRRFLQELRSIRFTCAQAEGNIVDYGAKEYGFSFWRQEIR
jgi:hypothetical protein